jgi:hypothetical protein
MDASADPMFAGWNVNDATFGRECVDSFLDSCRA